MKKISSYFLGFAAIALMAACSNDEIAPEVDNTTLPGIANGEAYLTVRLQDANAMTRAGEDEEFNRDGGYKNGIASEHKVKDAQFFFFDAEGVFVGKASVWNGGKDNPNGTHDEDDLSTGNNIEFKGNTVVVLRGVTEKSYPKYLLTVLNAEGFEPKATLPETSKSLVAWNKEYTETEGTTENKVDHFVMSTSSYFNNDTEHDNFYYATKIDPSKFKDEPYKEPSIPSASDDAVQIYVERLAAKVQVTTGADLQKADNDLYKVNVSIAGDPNNQGNPESEGITEVYVKFSKWGLNGTLENSYLSKQLKNDWKNNAPFAKWSIPDNFRCFWAESTVYGTDPSLSFTSYSNLSSVINGDYNKNNFGYAYCNENTNAVSNILANNSTTKVDPTKVTSVLIGAQVCDIKGKPLELVRHNGLLYKEKVYLNYVVNVLNNKKTINAYYEYTEEGTTKYKRLDGSFLKIERNAETQKLTAVINESTFTAETNFFSYNEQKELTPLSKEDAQKELEESWKAYTTNTLFECDEAFTNGMMYYNIPIEHLAGFGADKTIIEGSYGVVRNHWYQVVLNKIENLGIGVFDEEEPIIPEIPEEKYYLDATINILSWKVVNQSVDL